MPNPNHAINNWLQYFPPRPAGRQIRGEVIGGRALMDLEAQAVPDRAVWAQVQVQPEPFDNDFKGESPFRLVLSGIKEIYDVEATIAGGAVRDVAAGNPSVKDVDVFIPMKVAAFKKHVDELGWRGGVKFTPKPAGYSKEQGCVVPVVSRASALVKGHVIDLCFMDAPLTAEDVNKFPVHAQRGVFTLSDGLVLSPEARQDIDNKTFTIDPTITDKVRMQKILEKVQGWTRRDFYRGWKIVTPNIKEWWEVKDEQNKATLGVDSIPYNSEEF